MTTLSINDQTYDLLKQEFRPAAYINGNGKAHSVPAVDIEPAEPLTPELAMEEAVRVILESIGEDPERQGLQRTPQRVAKAFAELTSGYHVDATALVNDAVFDVTYDEMVLVKDIDFFSLCEHHMLPFYGKAHVAPRKPLASSGWRLSDRRQAQSARSVFIRLRGQRCQEYGCKSFL